MSILSSRAVCWQRRNSQYDLSVIAWALTKGTYGLAHAVDTRSIPAKMSLTCHSIPGPHIFLRISLINWEWPGEDIMGTVFWGKYNSIPVPSEIPSYHPQDTVPIQPRKYAPCIVTLYMSLHLRNPGILRECAMIITGVFIVWSHKIVNSRFFYFCLIKP